LLLLMLDFSTRSYKKELLDRDDIPFEDIRQNMQELDFINKWLGGHQITINGLKKLLPDADNSGLVITEIGCGGGDNLRVLKNYCEKKKIRASFIGIDINPHCIEFAKSRKENEGIQFIASDYAKVQFENKPDVIFASLFCHHFTDEELRKQFQWMKMNSGIGFFINDLHRHLLAYYSIKLLAALFSKSYLIKNDAPLSVLRGFKRKEIQMLNKACAIANAQLKWQWAFRWLLIVRS
jgi:2-polyprenyl-3-methyl-5-hydroxy-6-metoxy-1,4-benzoquinol methylase